MQLRKKLRDLADRTRESGDWDEFVWTSTCALSWAYSFWSSDQRIKTQRSRLRCNHNIPEIVQVASHKKRWVLRSVKQQFEISKHAGKRPRRAPSTNFTKAVGVAVHSVSKQMGHSAVRSSTRTVGWRHWSTSCATAWPPENESHWIPMNSIYIHRYIHHISSHSSVAYPLIYGFVWKCWVNLPNEIAIFHRDNDQQNHGVQWGSSLPDRSGPAEVPTSRWILVSSFPPQNWKTSSSFLMSYRG